MPKNIITGDSIVELLVLSTPGIITPEEEQVINPDYDPPESIWEIIIAQGGLAFIY